MAKNIVVAELVENIGGWDRVRNALDEIRACRDETQSFFGGIFDQLDSLCETLLTRQRQVENPAAERSDNVLASGTAGNNRLDCLLKEFDAGREEIRGAQQTVQEQLTRLAAAKEDLTAARNELQAARAELARQGQELSAISSQSISASQEVQSSIKDEIRQMDEQRSLLEKECAAMEKAAESNIQNKIQDVERQQALLENQRAAMEMELASVGDKAARIADMLAEQKRISAPQQAEWVENLLQMRAMLENLTRQFAQGKRQVEASPPVIRQTGVAAAASADPVLESVLAQFEVLQQDRVFRRSETAG